MLALRAGLAAALLASLPLGAQAPVSPLQFEVASIKLNTSGQFGTGPPILPGGEVRLVNMPVSALVLRAYPDVTPPVEVDGLPSWAGSEHYDVIAKGKPGATRDEQRQMWRALLADRMKLAAHYETRTKPAFDLVFARADHRLGPGLKPSTLDCTQQTGPPAPLPAGSDPRTAIMSRCNAFFIERDGTTTAAGVKVANLVQMITGTAGRPVIDHTGLDGVFAVTLRYQRMPPRADVPPSPDDPPSLFTALQEQLGLKLESSTTDAKVLVVDHIERPDPD